MKKHMKNLTRKINTSNLNSNPQRTNTNNSPNITMVKYNLESCSKKNIILGDMLELELDKSFNYWFIVNGVKDTNSIKDICVKFNINNIVLSNIINTSMRPCVDSYKHYTSVIFKSIKSTLVNGEIDLDIDQISLIVGENYLISFTESDIDNFEQLYFKIEHRIIKSLDISFLSYLLLDHIIEKYFDIMEEISDKIEEVEKNIISNPDKKSIEIIHNLKNDLLMLHKIIWSQRDSMNMLLKERDYIAKDELRDYYRDLYDHLFQINDIIEIFRDRLSSMLDIYLSSTSMKMNETMKVLAIISTVFMPLTFIAGVYGMNFSYMPELQMKYGYPVILLVMLLSALAMIKYFKKNNWF